MRQRLLVVLVLLVSGLGALSVAPTTATAAPPLVTRSPLQDVFFAYGDAGTGDRWTGSDGAYSTLLPDGRHLWTWGDTFLGRVNPDHSRQPQGFIHNAMTLMNADGSVGETLYTHDDGFGDRAFVETADKQTWYWYGDTTIEGDVLHQFLYRIVGGVIGGVDVASFSLPDMQLLKITTMPQAYAPLRQYGVAVVETAEWTYVYACETGEIQKFMHVARVPTGHLLDGAWEYWDGATWSPVIAASKRVLTGVADEMSVVKTKSGYRAIAQYFGITRDIYMYTARQPEGPWSAGTLLYTTPEGADGKLVTYNAKEHPTFAKPDRIVISYNVNTQMGDSNGLYSDVDNYRPRWIEVHMPSDLDVAPDSLTPVECDAPEVASSGAWQAVASGTAEGGRYCRTRTTSGAKVAELRLPFVGDRVDVSWLTGPDGGTATVLLDGEVVRTLDQHATSEGTERIQLQGLPAGPHELVVRAGTKSGTGRSTVTVDGFATSGA